MKQPSYLGGLASRLAAHAATVTPPRHLGFTRLPVTATPVNAIPLDEFEATTTQTTALAHVRRTPNRRAARASAQAMIAKIEATGETDGMAVEAWRSTDAVPRPHGVADQLLEKPAEARIAWTYTRAADKASSSGEPGPSRIAFQAADRVDGPSPSLAPFVPADLRGPDAIRFTQAPASTPAHAAHGPAGSKGGRILPSTQRDKALGAPPASNPEQPPIQLAQPNPRPVHKRRMPAQLAEPRPEPGPSLRIGSIEVVVTPPVPAPSIAASTPQPVSSLSRGFTTAFGLKQG